MVEKPDRFVESFVKAGADSLIVHHEVLPDPRPLLRRIRGLGKRVGLAVNPDSPIEAFEPYLGEIDLALCMTVHPGFGGQPYVPGSTERIRRLRGMIDRVNPKCELEVDGGIEQHTAPEAVGAGATVLVVGTGIFGNPAGPAQAVRSLLALAPGQRA
jgi:ribulose-phosphate 3-epimerase